MLRIRLPFPDRALNPNTRRVWQASLKPKKEAREVGYWAAREATNKQVWIPNRYPGLPDPYPSIYYLQESFDKDKPLCLCIAIHPPDNRRRDIDNIVAALKSYQDGIFDYLGMDDSQITRKEVVMRSSCPEGKVRYLLYQA